MQYPSPVHAEPIDQNGKMNRVWSFPYECNCKLVGFHKTVTDGHQAARSIALIIILIPTIITRW